MTGWGAVDAPAGPFYPGATDFCVAVLCGTVFTLCFQATGSREGRQHEPHWCLGLQSTLALDKLCLLVFSSSYKKEVQELQLVWEEPPQGYKKKKETQDVRGAEQHAALLAHHASPPAALHAVPLAALRAASTLLLPAGAIGTLPQRHRQRGRRAAQRSAPSRRAQTTHRRT